MKNILITGGAGFIGSHVVRLFVTKYPQYKIINFDALVEEGAIDADDLALFSMVDTAEEAWSELVRRGLKAHTPPDEAPTNGD